MLRPAFGGRRDRAHALTAELRWLRGGDRRACGRDAVSDALRVRSASAPPCSDARSRNGSGLGKHPGNTGCLQLRRRNRPRWGWLGVVWRAPRVLCRRGLLGRRGRVRPMHLVQVDVVGGRVEQALPRRDSQPTRARVTRQCGAPSMRRPPSAVTITSSRRTDFYRFSPHSRSDAPVLMPTVRYAAVSKINN
jgi:hypothetical protein